MRFAVKVVPLGALGFAVALLVACGSGNGLLSGSQAQDLQAALSTAQSACSGGDPASAARAAQDFADRVNALPGGTVDRTLIANLQQGAATLQALAPQTCTGTTGTATTPTVTTTTTPTTTTATTTTTTQPTAPTTAPTPTTPPTTPTTTPDNGGGSAGGGNGNGNGNGNGTGNPGGAAPGQLKKQQTEGQ